MKYIKNALKKTITASLLMVSAGFLNVYAAPEIIEIAGQRLSVDDYLGPVFSKLYQDQIGLALQKAAPQEKAIELRNVATNALSDAQRNGLSTFTEDLQNAYAQAITNIFEQQTPEAHEDIRALLTDAQNSPLLTPDQQMYVKNEMLAKLPVPAPQVPEELQAMTVTVDDITAALGASTYAQKVNALIVLLQKAPNQSFDAVTQDTFGNALVTVFSERTKQQPAALNKLVNLLTQAQTTPLLSSTQQAYVTQQMLPKALRKAVLKQAKRAAARRGTSKRATPKRATSKRAGIPLKKKSSRRSSPTVAFPAASEGALAPIQ